jgi:hypothetical protein
MVYVFLGIGILLPLNWKKPITDPDKAVLATLDEWSKNVGEKDSGKPPGASWIVPRGCERRRRVRCVQKGRRASLSEGMGCTLTY